MRTRDLFAGSGWGFACQQLGIEDHGVEIMPEARLTRELNGMATLGYDVRNELGWVGGYELELASPPCERFTATGIRDGMGVRDLIVRAVYEMRSPSDVYDVIADLDRFHDKIGLVLQPLRVLIENPHAKAAIWEQVPPVLPIWRAIASRLAEWGWSVDVNNVNASWYGVPQDRKRAILMARRDGYPARIPGYSHLVVMGDVFPDRLDWVQRSNYSGPASATKRTAAERGRTTRTMTQLSVTMTRKAAQWLRPDNSLVKMSVEDMAMIQSFPAHTIFGGGIQAQRIQIGNAVPPKMAKSLIQAVLGD